MILRLEQISKHYARAGGTKIAVDRVSLELYRGQIMGIFGPSGAGKTTLVRLAAGLEAPDDGVVMYKGGRLDQMSSAQRVRFRRREVGCVWAEQPWPEGLTVLEHVALPLLVDGYDHLSAKRLAHKFLLACEVDRCGDMGVEEISNGERQLVAIARAIVTEPRLLLVDGAVSNLSFIEQERVMRLLSSLADEAKVAVLVTGTEASSVMRADPLFYFCDGRLVNGKPVSELGKVYRFPSAGSRRAAANA
jgi:ABC-type methionine transport system ATPase subunit